MKYELSEKRIRLPTPTHSQTERRTHRDRVGERKELQRHRQAHKAEKS